MAFKAGLAALGAGAAAAGVAQAIGEGSPTHRQVLINITNGCSSYTLVNPSWYTYSGSCSSPLPPTIPSNGSGSALFIKTPHTACGSVGVLTYDLLYHPACQPCEKMAVMFSNPYDFNLYSNWFAVGVFEQSRQCDHGLYHEMYNGASQSFVRSQANDAVLKYEGRRARIEATMSNSYQPVMKVQVSETNGPCSSGWW